MYKTIGSINTAISAYFNLIKHALIILYVMFWLYFKYKHYVIDGSVLLQITR